MDHTLNTLRHVIPQKRSHVLSKFTMCGAAFMAIPGGTWPAGHRWDTPALGGDTKRFPGGRGPAVLAAAGKLRAQPRAAASQSVLPLSSDLRGRAHLCSRCQFRGLPLEAAPEVTGERGVPAHRSPGRRVPTPARVDSGPLCGLCGHRRVSSPSDRSRRLCSHRELLLRWET